MLAAMAVCRRLAGGWVMRPRSRERDHGAMCVGAARLSFRVHACDTLTPTLSRTREREQLRAHGGAHEGFLQGGDAVDGGDAEVSGGAEYWVVGAEEAVQHVGGGEHG